MKFKLFVDLEYLHLLKFVIRVFYKTSCLSGTVLTEKYMYKLHYMLVICWRIFHFKELNTIVISVHWDYNGVWLQWLEIYIASVCKIYYKINTPKSSPKWSHKSKPKKILQKTYQQIIPTKVPPNSISKKIHEKEPPTPRKNSIIR